MVQYTKSIMHEMKKKPDIFQGIQQRQKIKQQE